MNKQYIPLIMTIVSFLLIVSIMGVARWSLNISKKVNYQTADKIEPLYDKGLNTSEVDILRKLSIYMNISNSPGSKENHPIAIYLDILRKYLYSSGVDLSVNTANAIDELLNDVSALIDLEKESDINKMSFEGREVAIYILKHIYELCGLRLEISSEGNINQIIDQYGKVIYKNSKQEQTGFQVKTLIFTLFIILVFLSFSIILTKKNQLFYKGGEYDGINEKRIA